MGTEQQGAFDTLKNSLANAETLAYFDSNAEETKLITDASPVGLGAVLTQVQGGCERVVAYASRSLTDVERRYSQTDKEALARTRLGLREISHVPIWSGIHPAD